VLLENRVAIITGGAVGMGRGIALKFAEEGCSVVVSDIREVEGKETAAEVSQKGVEGIFISCDVTDSRQVNDMVAKVIDKFGKIDILATPAGGMPGVTPGEGIVNITDELWDKIVDLNLKGQFRCCRAVIPHMKEKKYGKIITFSSMGVLQAPHSMVPYVSAKAGVLGLTTNLAFEVAPLNICVNNIMPGAIRTHFYDSAIGTMTDKEKEDFFAGLARDFVPMQRVGTTEDIAGVALFLASDLSSYVTGVTLYVSGGIPMIPHPHDEPT